ncbi:GNAT family N-acetyltransferase [Amycolatopsis australiensis]|uniref:Acetyltransferase (GNAT) family protein n=1 Tax=Amycolatopsis australiensis TaxID=546364 RepID=A0A1K1PFD3_9PSEU|nr:GNAT family N-acetyltransferase [Amycolatopsis australiensis]SFW46498.1 Acetyltransferase (GNAT) family protein [Amycolatopsis australiensis]
MEWTITELPVDHPDAVAIMREYMAEVASRYFGRPVTEAEITHYVAEEPGTDLVPPTGAFLLGRRGGELAGCAGTRVVAPGVTELTKVFVRPAHRGTGGGPALVAAAEDAARRLGSRLMRLDTRHDLVEARALYAKTGYAEVEPFNDEQFAEHWFAKALN